MILILANRHSDATLDYVADWLTHYEVSFIQLTINDFADGHVQTTVGVGGSSVFYKGIDLLKEVNVIWFRGFSPRLQPYEAGKITFSKQEIQAYSEIQDECMDIVNHLFYKLRNRAWFPHYEAVRNNKIVTLERARSLGLSIPETRILSARSDVERFLSEKNELIFKPAYFVGYYISGDSGYTAFTKSVDAHLLQEMPDNFFPALFQEKISGDLELRITFIDGTFFSCCWYFGGIDKNIDKKLNETAQRNHYQPYTLPQDVREKLSALMGEMNLRIGTIDMIVSGDEYIFLEVNPCGLFLFESEKCNFHLEKVLAECLIMNDCRLCE